MSELYRSFNEEAVYKALSHKGEMVSCDIRNWIDPSLNRDFRQWAEHNGTVITPAKVKSPRWKPEVESGLYNPPLSFSIFVLKKEQNNA